MSRNLGTGPAHYLQWSRDAYDSALEMAREAALNSRRPGRGRCGQAAEGIRYAYFELGKGAAYYTAAASGDHEAWKKNRRTTSAVHRFTQTVQRRCGV